MKTLALGLCLLLPAGAAFAAEKSAAPTASVTDIADYDAAVKAGHVISLPAKKTFVFPERPLPADITQWTLAAPDGPVALKGGAPNGRLLHTEVEEAMFSFTGKGPIFFTGFSHVGEDNIKEKAWGGAFYAANGLTLNSSVPLVFLGNHARGGEAAGGKTSHSSGQGGAFCTDGKLQADGKGPFIFAGNGAEGGRAGTAGSVENSGQGGAVYVEKGLYLMGGDWIFTGNLARGADAQSLKTEAYDSGYGGALNSTYEFVLDRRGSYTFIGNRAMGGKASLSGNCDASGQGGAVYCVDNMEIHNGVFLLNSAGTENAKDMSSGVGGAIYHEAYGNDYVIMLKAGKDKPLVFAGNSHNPGNQGPMLNSVYFGNTEDENRSSTTFVVDCEEGATALLLDPIAGQPEGTTGKKPDHKIMDVSVDVHKTGPGLWVLGGHNRMAGPTTWRVEEGTLRLTRDAFGAPSHIELGSKKAAEFALDKGTVLEVTPWEEPAQISGVKMTLAPGSAVRLADAKYSAKLKTGEPVVVLRVKGSGESTIDSALPETSGTVTLGDMKYAYKDLAWKTNGDTAELSCVFTAQ